MININQKNLFSDKIGSKHGITKGEVKKLTPRLREALKNVHNKRLELEWMDLPYQTKVIKAILDSKKKQQKKWENIVVLGIGGSSLGGIALMQALKGPYYNLDHKPRLFFADNIDPDQINWLMKLNLRKTLIIVISKSGGTAETMSQFLIFKKLLKDKLKKNYKKHLITITDEQHGLLREITNNEKLESFIVPPGVGGRFSVLSAVGLLPASLIGINIKKLCQGAKKMDILCQKEDLKTNPALKLAMAQYLFDREKKKNMTVLMPYSTNLERFSDWYRQLLAESIGKNEKTGPTPIKALGVTDQHSQIQLYNEGPNNKLIIFIEVENFESQVYIPRTNLEALNYMSGKTLNQLIKSELTGTKYSLTKENRPNQTIVLNSIDEEAIGGLLYLFEVQVALLGELYRVDAFNQPGVEAGKIMAKKILKKC